MEREYIKKLHNQAGSVSFFVEFRHSTWNRAEAVNFCREQGLGWVAVDLPPLPGLPSARPAVTTPIAYVRMHGRNSRTWYNPEAGDRYDWEYDTDQLREWLPRLAAMTQRADETFLFFNNCHAGQAIKSAILMKELMRQEQYNVA